MPFARLRRAGKIALSWWWWKCPVAQACRTIKGLARAQVCALLPLCGAPVCLKVSYSIGMMVSELLRAWRHHEEMSVRDAADRIGIPWSTYARVEKGYPMSGETWTAILLWMLGS
ncbi:helix-turn-helix transcriptional regulator [Telmatobacter sp. DSM 110680]|uniref:Helix-turn-helix transcriptional regulator n=1 Tax=Telmatobacter sp. DSM 110680 TaxID=3036704 RepID=A0AAU7DRX0_9BACT